MMPGPGDVIAYRPIGYVRHEYSDDEVSRSLGGVEAVIEILPDYAEGLRGIQGFSHIIVVAHLHRVKSYRLVGRPRGFMKVGLKEEELPEVGVFCTASPLRPNPIAITVMELLRVEGRALKVRGCDLYNGTPVLDIKPFTPSRCPPKVEVPAWLEEIRRKALSRTGVDIYAFRWKAEGRSERR